VRVLDRLREGIAGQAEGQAVGIRDRVVQRVEAAHRGDRTEGLVVEHVGLERHVGEDGGREEVARAPTRRPPSTSAPTARASSTTSPSRRPARVGQRAQRACLGQAVTEP
jgi:hypothetical protein